MLDRKIKLSKFKTGDWVLVNLPYEGGNKKTLKIVAWTILNYVKSVTIS